MKMYIKSVVVDDQAAALDFYTRVMGFAVKHDIPMGEYRWLTVVSPEEPDGVELLLEPNAHPASKTFQETLLADGIPWTSFSVTDLAQEHARMKAMGVEFTQEPTEVPGTIMAACKDGCGNIIQIIQLLAQ